MRTKTKTVTIRRLFKIIKREKYLKRNKKELYKFDWTCPLLLLERKYVNCAAVSEIIFFF